MWHAALWLVSGCSTPSPTPVPYLPDAGPDLSSAQLDDASLASAISENVPRFIEAVPLALPQAIEPLLALADANCPEIDEYNDGQLHQRIFYDDCVTAAGVQFSGGLEWTTFTELDDGEGAITNGFELYAEALNITTPDGQVLEAAGFFYVTHTQTEDSESSENYSAGTLGAQPDLGDPWLSGQVSGSNEVYLGDFGGYRYASVTGSLQLQAPGVFAMALQGIEFAPDECATEPAGTISVREDGGVWHDLVFDFDAEEATNCDRCGAHLVSGITSAQPLCLDGDPFAALVDWDGGMPW